MKKKNLKIAQLNVKSFVTSLQSDETNTVKGGKTYNCPPPTYTCPPSQAGCGGSNGCGQTNIVTACDFNACNA